MSLESNILKVLHLLSVHFGEIQQSQRDAVQRPPLILGLTGLQGSGKSTWATAIVTLLSSHFGLKAVQVSLDDFYQTHGSLVKIRKENPNNKLLRTRGQPGTHDEALASSFFQHLRRRKPGLAIPVFEKSLHNGEGDRLPENQWPALPHDVDVVVFEGWCVGFQPLAESEIVHKQQSAQKATEAKESSATRINTLSEHPLGHLLILNESLKRYCDLFMGPHHFDFLVHLDTNDLNNVYTWRLEQEHALSKARGSGMSDDQVIDFVRGYMPAYELYLDQLRGGFFPPVTLGDHHKPQINVLLGREREILKVSET